MINSNKILNFLILLIISNIVLLSIFSNHWGYDEFGAVTSHLELSNSNYINEYKLHLNNIGISNQYIIDCFISYFLPLIIVPLRWTYAIGISPWLAISNYVNIDWPYLRPILMIPYVFLIWLGLILIKRALTEIIGPFAIAIFYLLILCSSPFLYWANTLTSYSHHIFIFGIIIYAFFKCDFNSHIFNKKSVLLAIVPLFNYQYIAVICTFCVVDWLQNIKYKKFLFLLKIWFLPIITCCLSLIFLLLRASISGKHQDPAYASLNGFEMRLYSIPSNFEFSIKFFDYIMSIYIDIMFSFYRIKIDHFTNYGTLYSILFLILIISLIYININKSKKLTILLCLIIGTTLFFQFIGILHVAPKRHQLVLFLPAVLLFAIWLSHFYLKFINSYRPYNIIFGLIVLSLIYKINTFSFIDNSFPIDYARSRLDSEGVERLVLNSCDYEPVLYNDIRVTYKPIYKCGPRVMDKLPIGTNKIAVWSSFPINAKAARDIISDYSDSDWILDPSQGFNFSQDCSYCSRLWIAKRLDQKR